MAGFPDMMDGFFSSFLYVLNSFQMYINSFYNKNKLVYYLFYNGNTCICFIIINLFILKSNYDNSGKA